MIAAGLQDNRLLRLAFQKGEAPCDVLLINRFEGGE